MLLNTPVPLKIPTESTWRTDIRLEESLFVKGLFIKCRQGQGNSAIRQGKQHQRSFYHPGSRGTRGVSHWRTWEREGPVGCRRLSAGNTEEGAQKRNTVVMFFFSSNQFPRSIGQSQSGGERQILVDWLHLGQPLGWVSGKGIRPNISGSLLSTSVTIRFTCGDLYTQ